MLLESLKQTEDILEINDFLSNPKTNHVQAEKIKFTLKYSHPVLEKKTGCVRELDRVSVESFSKKLDVKNDLIYLEEIDFMSTTINSANGFLSNYDNTNFSQNTINNSGKKMRNQSTVSLKNAIGRSTLTLAQLAFNPNNILNDEVLLVSDDSLTENNSETVLNDSLLMNQDVKELITQIIGKKISHKLNSWIIRVQLIEIKHLLGNEKNVYCTVRIGNQLFKTSVKPIDKLRFNEVCN